jgi:hypothetical protein
LRRTNKPAPAPEAAAPETVCPVTKPGLKPGIADYIAGEAREFKISELKPLPAIRTDRGLRSRTFPGRKTKPCGMPPHRPAAPKRFTIATPLIRGAAGISRALPTVLASNPHSWCPLAAALPGNSEYWDTPDRLYLRAGRYRPPPCAGTRKRGACRSFLGASRTLLPRVQTHGRQFRYDQPGSRRHRAVA